MEPQAWITQGFTDVARLGAPLTALCIVPQLVLIPLVFPL
jgi:hypothetical protein